MPAHGDLSSNAAMVVAKPLGKNPREVATALAEHFKADPDVDSVEVAGPGFLNFRLDEPVWHRVLKSDRRAGRRLTARPTSARATRSMSSTSRPTRPARCMSGHTRGAVFGDALASLLAYVGYDVTREYYINDAGGQVDVLAQSAFLRYREALGETIEIPSGFYPGDYLKPGRRAARRRVSAGTLLDMPEAEWLPNVKELTLKMMLELIKTDLANLGVKHDVFFSERTLHGQGGDIDLTLDWLREQGLVYQGRLEPPKGSVDEDWEDREQTLFRATEYRRRRRPGADQVGRQLHLFRRRHRLSPQQVSARLQAHDQRARRRPLGLRQAAQGGGEGRVGRRGRHRRQDHAARPAAEERRAVQDEQAVAATSCCSSDVVEEVGVDATRFMLLYRRNEQAMDFDFALVKEQTRDNPVFYVQYAHARTCSVFRTAETRAAGARSSAGAS